MKKIVILILLVSIRFINAQTLQPISDPEKYIRDFVNLIQQKSVYSKKIDWVKTDAKLKPLILKAKTSGDVYPALRYILTELRIAGDFHSKIRAEGSQNTINNKKEINPQAKLIDGKMGYILVPSTETTKLSKKDFALKIQSLIKDLDTKNEITGWIVDLRENGGGSISPMILGLSALLDEENLGYFVRNDGTKNPWNLAHYRELLHDDDDYKVKNQNSKFAVLVGKKTGSAAEATAISFIGKSNAKLFGQATAGLTSANETFPLSDGKKLALATAFEMDRNGKEYRAEIQPDVRVEEIPGEDAVLDAAKKWLNEK